MAWLSTPVHVAVHISGEMTAGDVVVGVGTLLLAAFTGLLAHRTRQDVDASRDSIDLARQEVELTRESLSTQARPALIPGLGRHGGASVPDAITSTRLLYDGHRNHLVVNVRNAGRGPALFVRISLEPTGNSPENGPLAAMAPGDEVQLIFAGEHDQPSRWQVLLDYRDLAGQTYSTAIGIETTPSLRFYDVRTFEDRTLTPHGDALPQEGVTDFVTG
jgi:hypothetical protein